MSRPDPIAAVEAEDALLGCVMQMTREQAADELPALNVDTHLTTPRARSTARALITLVDAGVDPTPVAALAELQRRGDLPSWSTSTAAGVWLAELVADAPPARSFSYLLGALQESAVRRRVAALAVRLGQAAGTSGFDELLGLVDREYAAVREVTGRP